MENPHGKVVVPTSPDRLEGADRSGLGEKGWAEVPDDLIGHPDDTNIAPELHQDQVRQQKDKRV